MWDGILSHLGFVIMKELQLNVSSILKPLHYNEYIFLKIIIIKKNIYHWKLLTGSIVIELFLI